MADFFVYKRGATGARITFTLSDSAGKIDLTGWTVVMTLKKGNETPFVDEAPCVIESDQTTNRGKVNFYFENYAGIPAGTYSAEVKATNTENKSFIFPSNKSQRYGRVVVFNSLS